MLIIRLAKVNKFHAKCGVFCPDFKNLKYIAFL